MRFLYFAVLALLISSSCTKKNSSLLSEFNNQTIQATKDYPAALNKVFDTHGSISQWKTMKSLSYEIIKEGGNEKQWIDLVNRNERIESSNFKTGYNGKEYWLEADTSYKGNAKFYHNLIFYFYAMPFVLGDDGIVYSETAPLEFEGTSYPGIRISYNQGVGESPEDEYFIHYNPTTHKMEWLGYTVTFYSGEKSNKISWIRYNDWGDQNGLLLPNSLTWYKVEEGKLVEPRSKRTFVNIKLSKEQPKAKIFEKTPNAKIIE